MTPSHAPARLRLPIWLRRSLCVVGSGCAASGALWLWLHNFGQRDGEFGLEPHPWEHPDLVVHGTTGLLLLWLAGTLWFPHIRAGWRQRGLCATGVPMLVLFTLPAGTAAGLYYLGYDIWRGWASLAHWIAGLGAIVWPPVHLFAGVAPCRKAARAAMRTDGASMPRGVAAIGRRIGPAIARHRFRQ